MSGLRVATDLELPIDLVVQKTAILARSGAGKTNTAVDIVEELLAAKQQVVILDPPGAWWGLRSSADGKQAGYPVAVLGGMHGDVPLEPAAGAVVADLIVDEALSAVLDLSEFTDGEIARFVGAFAQRLYARKNVVRDPLLLVMEEADELAPQNLPAREKGEGGQALMLHHIERIAKRGRMRGIGFLAITQRSAALNKHVLSQVELLIAMQTTAPQDIAAINDWVKEHGDQERHRQLLAEIAGLPIGTGFIWSPSWLRIFRKVAFRKRRTFDSSATPEPGKRQIAPKTLADVDLQALSAKMAATIEKAKADDPRELRKIILTHERMIQSLRQQKPAEARTIEVEKIVEVVPKAHIELLRRLSRDLVHVAAELSRYSESIDTVVGEQILELIAAERTPVPRIDPVPREHKRPPPHSPAPRPEAERSGSVTAPQQRILDALASFETVGLQDVGKNNVAVWANQSPTSGGYANNLGALRSRGLIRYPSAGRVALTDEGRTLAAAESISSLEELHAAWERRLPRPQWRILKVLIDHYPGGLARPALAEDSGQSATSGGYANNLGALRSLGLLDYPSSGMVAATDLLFPALGKR